MDTRVELRPTGELRQSPLTRAMEQARAALLGRQAADGHWCFELESDATITAEYILMTHFMDEIDDILQAKLARYLRATQQLDSHGGWPLYHGGDLDLSCTVKAYFALKAAGDSAEAPHMRRAREAVLERGGAAKANVFTRMLLAMFGQVPWRATPYTPVELMLFPRWAPIHVDKVAYWARTTMIPLMALCSMQARAANPRGAGIAELFVTPAEEERDYFARGGVLNRVFLALDKLGRAVDPLIPKAIRRKAIQKAADWCAERMNGEDGLGAIFPPMVNAYEMYHLLGYPADHPLMQTCRKALHKLLVFRPDGSAYCQPCVSPVWDTAWALMALQHTGDDEVTQSAVQRGYDWLLPRQVLELRGDWKEHCSDQVRPGGWAFQYANDYYPDIDDTAVVAGMLHSRAQRLGDPQRYREATDRAAEWMLGLQSKNGGFAAFDADCTRYYLNSIPFADHGALLDPPTEDVTGRVLACLGLLKRPQDAEVIRRGVEYLRTTQLQDGSWWGRWGTNYVYGTWSALAGLALVGEDRQQPYIRKAIEWLYACQNADGGWGETNDSYLDPALAGQNQGVSTPNHTAWALLALIAIGEADHPAVARGIEHLLATQQADGLWHHPSHNAPGFPRVYYLKYHGYTAYFPLWALSQYRRRRSAAAS
ncbi:squalene--hopene cyclase [Frateuria aurantia]|uniref:Squalene-hopene cyclase n=1 Tax=Frateuria aurantia (strain ATCC 33424 / DSM 6220 / KCTC 2777 / LMG 1558 / NBRC 3245 / NCIMB 13370) TaxID=767434 RepID=H8L1C6_FRAAD|nr:squalene--hopene cyclase [Frateuria aurantia]AFC87535.1 squalene-hopene cyclase [Frateuria aurantia DSM 6220]